jgi:hypothetical protein
LKINFASFPKPLAKNYSGDIKKGFSAKDGYFTRGRVGFSEEFLRFGDGVSSTVSAKFVCIDIRDSKFGPHFLLFFARVVRKNIEFLEDVNGIRA